MASDVTPLKQGLSMSKQSNDDAELDIEYGVPPVLPGGAWADWSGGIDPKNKDKVGGFVVGRDPTAPSTTELLNMVRRDGQARALLNLLTLPIRGTLATGSWHPPDGEKDTAPEVQYANDMWNLPSTAGGMEVPKSMFLRQTLLSFAHGFSCFEQVRRVPKDGPLKGKIVIKKLSYRDPRTVWFLTDENGNYGGFRQTTSFANRSINVAIPTLKSYYYTVLAEENPFYGVSLFEPAFEHHQIKRKLYYISHLAAQFAAVPGRVMEMPPNPGSNTKIEKMRSALMQFAFGGSIMVPNGWKMQSPFGGTGQFDFLKLIDHHNTMMAASVLAKFLQQEDRQVLIDNGKSDASADMFVQMLDAFSDEIAESWSREIMPQYIDYNFGSGIVPEFRFGPLTDDQRSSIQTMFQSVVLAGTLNCTPEFVRQMEKKLATMFDLDIDYDKIEKAEKDAAKAQQEQQAQQDQMAQQQGLPPGGGDQGPGGPPSGTPPPAGPGGPPAIAPAAAPPVAAAALDVALDSLLVELSQIAGRDVTTMGDFTDEGVPISNIDFVPAGAGE